MIQILEKEFKGTGEVKGFIFTQLKETKYCYLYLKEKNGSKSYEVIRKNAVPIYIDFNLRIFSQLDLKEIYPKSRQFGKEGWEFLNMRKALKKLEDLERIHAENEKYIGI